MVPYNLDRNRSESENFIYVRENRLATIIRKNINSFSTRFETCFDWGSKSGSWQSGFYGICSFSSLTKKIQPVSKTWINRNTLIKC